MLKKKNNIGVVKFYNDNKGFGYITDDETKEEIYVSESQIDPDLLPLEEGATIAFDLAKGDKEDYAKNVRTIGTEPRRNPKIITFYSHKGGTGRTMAMANVACLLAKETEGKVLMIDWDLEAPGLHEYFRPYLNGFEQKDGLIEFLMQANETLDAMPYGKEDEEKLDAFLAKISNYPLKINAPTLNDNLYILKAGKFDNEYGQKINDFSWDAFFTKIPAFFTRLAYFLREQYDYVLIDSRTGHTDTGGICTKLMPEKLVLVFTPNKQSLNGVIKMAKDAVDYRLNSDDLRPLNIYPLPSRVEIGEDTLRQEWTADYTQQFTNTIADIYKLNNISLKHYLDEVQLMYIPKYAYGESVPILEENNGNGKALSITTGYKNLVRYFDEEIWGEEMEDEGINDEKQDDKKLNVYLLLPQKPNSIGTSIILMFDKQLGNSVSLKFKKLEDNFDIDYENQTELIANSDIIYILYSDTLKENTFVSSFFTNIVEDLKIRDYEIILIHSMAIDFNNVAHAFLKPSSRLPYKDPEKIPSYIQKDIEKRIMNKKMDNLKDNFIKKIPNKNAK